MGNIPPDNSETYIRRKICVRKLERYLLEIQSGWMGDTKIKYFWGVGLDLPES
jgi:hypothetical protein